MSTSANPPDLVMDTLSIDRPALLPRLAGSAPATLAAYLVRGVTRPELLRSHDDDRALARRHVTGDEIVGHPHWLATLTTRIDAPSAEVWPWLVQMGWGRAGFYSWYAYDNGGVPSADRIVPELQDLAVGDVIAEGPRARDGFGVWRVYTVQPPRALVLVSRRDAITQRDVAPDAAPRGAVLEESWAFVLEPISRDACRLVLRSRARIEGERFLRSAILSLGARTLRGFGDRVMERTMLEGIKARAERRWAIRRASSRAATAPHG